MASADALLAVMWAGLTAYVLFGGADFGGVFWDLVAGRAHPGLPQRKLIEHSIGPVWETNHVWLIFVIVLLWTGFPSAYAALAATMVIPLTLAALGIITRGAAFAFRKVSDQLPQQRLFGAAFAFSSVVTPFFLGTVAGGIASGRVLPDVGASDLITSWWNPTSIITGLLAVAVGAYLAAVYLTRDAQQHAPPLVPAFHRRALGAGLVTGALAAVGLLVLRVDAPWLFARLFTGPAAALVGVSVAAGVGSLALLRARRYLAVRLTAGAAVTALLWAWALAQYPYLLPAGVTVTEAAASPAVLAATLGSLVVGALLLLPSLWWLFSLFQREREHPTGGQAKTG